MLTTLADSEDMITALGAMGVAAIWIAAYFAHRIARTVSREKTRREIAAYIAEGSMTAEQGERLLKAGNKGEEQGS